MVAPVDSMNIPNSTLKKRFSRRDFLKVTALLGLDVFLLGVAGVGYVRNIEPSWVDVRQVKLRLPRLPRSFSGLRMVQLSDIHIGPWMTLDRVREIFGMAAAQSPDVVALTGDFVLAYGRMSRSYQDELDEMAKALKSLSERALVAAVLGNHDYWYNAGQVRKALEQGGTHVLANSVLTLARGAERLHIAGMDDAYVGQNDLEALLENLPTDGCALLLAHEPDVADASAVTGRFDLQVSGHSHGGQVVLPIIGPPILPELGQKYPSGLYQVGNMFQYTNRGVGMSFPAVRFNCRPEITIFTLL